MSTTEKVVVKKATRWRTEAYKERTDYGSGHTYTSSYTHGGKLTIPGYIAVWGGGSLAVLTLAAAVVTPIAWAISKGDRTECEQIERVQNLETEYSFWGGCTVEYDSNDKYTVDVDVDQED